MVLTHRGIRPEPALPLTAVALGILALLLGAGCARGGSQDSRVDESQTPRDSTMADIHVTSPAFNELEPIPVKHTCDGRNLSPPLAWEGVPAGAKSIALICDDPDAPVGTWVHWVLYNLPPAATRLPEAVPPDPEFTDGSRQGISDFDRTGYGGPCPPRGRPHRYFFKLYALDTTLDLEGTVTKKKLERAMKGHVLAQGQIIGTYKRR